MKQIIFLLLACIFAVPATAQTNFHAWAKTPPMGWNSWDCYGPTVEEHEVKANAAYMAKHLKRFGWEYVVVDIRWFVENDKAGGYNQKDPRYVIDEFGRYTPAVNRFPSAAGGQGFKPLADHVHALGLKFGIHVMRGVPVEAVRGRLPVKGTNVTADRIFSRELQCTWLRDNYTIADRPGAQEYYNSIFELYASWGVDFVKIDDLSRPYHEREIEMIREAIDRCGRPIVLSMSPGATPVEKGEHAAGHANMWRMVDDLWDSWRDVAHLMEVARAWTPFISPAWPDCDMIPLGRISVRGERGEDRMTRLSRDEQRSLMTFFSIVRSPLMFGGDLPSNDPFTLSLLTNREVLEMHREGSNVKIDRLGTRLTVTSTNAATGERYVALFNLSDDPAPAKYDIRPEDVGLARKQTLTDLWTGKRSRVGERLVVELAAHACVVFKGKAEAAPAKGQESYLLVYFKDDTHGLYMATSADGYTFVDVNNGRPVVAGDTIASQKGIRDPHIARGPDGAFYLAMTDLHIFGREAGYRETPWERDGNAHGWGNNRGFVLMKSFDLIRWTRANVFVEESFPDLNVSCAWAPETIYDEKEGKMMLYFTMRLDNGKTKLYYAYTDDDFTKLVTRPRLLFEYPDTNVQVLDADITALPDGRFCMMYVAQERPGGIKMAFSDRINGGYVYEPRQVDAEEGACEAPNVWRRGDKWVLMYDIFSIQPHNFGFRETTDFVNFKNLGHFNKGTMRATNFISPKHGAVISIAPDEAARLWEYWSAGPWTREGVALDSIRLSDPCILADQASNAYYMTGTGGMLWKSKDMKSWDGPYRAIATDPSSWMGPMPVVWAAELHAYKGKYYYFATFTNRAEKIDTVKGNAIERRACHVLVSDHPGGPYVPMSDPVYLPADRPTLDGTFWVDTDGKPYMVYCHEWLQNWNGTVEKIRLKPDLSGTEGKGRVLFFAFDSPWSSERVGDRVLPNKVTDGPWLFRAKTGRLGMLWTSWVMGDYTQGVAYSESGTLDGPWVHDKEPITPPNHGHGMLFRALDGRLLMSVHSHKNVNGRYVRVPRLFEVDDSGDRLVVGKQL